MAVNGVGSTYRTKLARLTLLGDVEGSKLAVGNRLRRLKYGNRDLLAFLAVLIHTLPG